jgi:hypothetical protein
MPNNYKYIIGSGWWCSENSEQTCNNKRKLMGAPIIRKADFHSKWYESVISNTNPEKIVIIDSNSPIKPNLNKEDNRIVFISLPSNSGHSVDCTEKFCGWTKSVILSLQYAVLANVDYFVYVEQDVLLRGNGIIEHCIHNMKKPYMFGHPEGTPQPLQQSLFIIRISHANKFLSSLFKLNSSDSELSPENKFVYASSRLQMLLDIFYFSFAQKKAQKLAHKFKNFDYLPFGYGRTRPINFSEHFYYFQHGTVEEIKLYDA